MLAVAATIHVLLPPPPPPLPLTSAAVAAVAVAVEVVVVGGLWAHMPRNLCYAIWRQRDWRRAVSPRV